MKQGFKVTRLKEYIDTRIHEYMDKRIQEYMDTSIQLYMDTWIYGHKHNRIQKRDTYKDTGYTDTMIQGYPP